MFSQATITGRSPSPDSEIVSAEATDTTNLTQKPSILVETAVSVVTTAAGINAAYSDAGDTVSFEIIVMNTGNTRLSKVILTGDKFGDDISCDHDFSGASSGFLPWLHPEGHAIVCEATLYLTSMDVDNSVISGTTKVRRSIPRCSSSLRCRLGSESLLILVLANLCHLSRGVMFMPN